MPEDDVVEVTPDGDPAVEPVAEESAAVDVVAITEAALEVLTAEVKDFYENEGKQMLEEDQALIRELAEDSAVASYHLATAMALGDELKIKVYKRNLLFISSTLQLRLMRRELQLAEQARERLQSLLGGLVDMLGKTLPALLKLVI